MELAVLEPQHTNRLVQIETLKPKVLPGLKFGAGGMGGRIAMGTESFILFKLNQALGELQAPKIRHALNPPKKTQLTCLQPRARFRWRLATFVAPEAAEKPGSWATVPEA